MQAQVDVAELAHLESIEAVADLLSIKQHRDQSMSGAQLNVGVQQGLAEADFAVVDEGILVAIRAKPRQKCSHAGLVSRAPFARSQYDCRW